MEQLETAIVEYLTTNNYTIVRPTEDSRIMVEDDVKLKFWNCDTSNFATYYDTLYGEVIGYADPNTGTNPIKRYITAYNNFSMVVELTHLNHKFLFTGDIEPVAQGNIASKIEYCDVLKVEHHSVNAYVNEDYVRKLYPKVAVVMETADITINRPEISSLKIRGAVIYTANTSGNVYVTSDITGIRTISSFGPSNTLPISSGLGLQLNNIRDVYHLGSFNDMPQIGDNDDLDDYITAGIYRGSSANTIQNRPFKGAGFKLIVEWGINSNRIHQTIKATTGAIYVRQINIDAGVVTKTDWGKVYTTAGDYGINLEDGTDLNDITTAGDYYVLNATSASTIINSPHTVTAFKLKVEYLHDKTRFRQTIYASDSACDTYIRTYTVNGWTGWFKLNLTQV